MKLEYNADGFCDIASSSGEIGYSSVWSSRLRLPSRCTSWNLSLGMGGKGSELTGSSSFDRTSDKIWDSINKGVSYT